MSDKYLDPTQQARAYALLAARDLLHPKRETPPMTSTWTQITGVTPPMQWWPLVQVAAFITTGDTLTEEGTDDDDDN